MLPPDYSIRLMQPADFAVISDICRIVYPNDTPYTQEELAEHQAVFPQGQFVAEHLPSGLPVGVHFTLRTTTSTIRGTCSPRGAHLPITIQCTDTRSTVPTSSCGPIISITDSPTRSPTRPGSW